MRDDFLPFSRPVIGPDEISAVVDVLRSGWITTGSRAAAFERGFCDYVGARGAIALTSATAGMHLLLRALGIGPGDEVVTPSMTWVSTVNQVVLAGARPVFADVDRETLMVTPESVAESMTAGTRLVLPVHFAGAPADIDGISEVAAERGIPVAWDAAHATGTMYKGQRIGARGTCIFSFHPIKNMTTGEGGMLVSEDEELLDRVRRLKFHGLGVDAYDREGQGRAPQAEVLEPGFKYNLTDIQAALGLVQLSRVEEFNRARAELAGAYLERLRELDSVRPLGLPAYDAKHAWHLFIVRLCVDDAPGARDRFMEGLKARNIGTGLHFKAVHRHRYYRETMPVPAGALPNTEWNSDRILSLPLFPGMSSGDVEDVVDAILEELR